MRLPDDFDDNNGGTGISMFNMVVGVCAFVLVLLGIIIGVNYKNNGGGSSAANEPVEAESENDLDQAMAERTKELVSGSTLRADDLDFWDRYPEETEETKESKKESEPETEETEPDPATDGKHTLVTYASGKEEWVSINPYIKKNNYDYTNLVSQNNIMKYYDGSKLVSYLGVDLSKTEGHVDFDAMKAAGVNFVMLRTGSRGYGSGELMVDDYFEEHINGALAAGLNVGLYFDSAAVSVEEAKQEAAMLLAQIGERKITYPIAFCMGFASNDTSRIDDLTPAQRTEITRAFLDDIALAGYKPMVYGDKEWLIKEIELGKLGDYDFWLSQPGDLPDYPYAFSIWQYSISQSMDGVIGSARLNISFINYSEK